MPQHGPTAPDPSRPYMPGYGLDGATSPPGQRLPWSRVEEILASSRNYWVGTTWPGGRPHAVPVWGLWLDSAFYFSTGRRTRKARNLAANPEIVVHIESLDIAVILEGAAEVISDPSLFDRFVAAYEAKYDWRPESGTWADFLQAGPLYAVRPRVAFSFTEDLAETATRWRFPSR